ncbi:hypothetical protein B0H14DRAFT_3149949 [Mycena olivaceomarginata]|nr:hypothetical protein B0H14DRAFT_3149949 [Mycena olivaceomarginata]
MNHPYNGAASYIYANERQYTPIDPRTKDPYGKRQSLVPSPLDQDIYLDLSQVARLRLFAKPHLHAPPVAPTTAIIVPAHLHAARSPNPRPAPRPAPRAPDLKPITAKPRRRRLLLPRCVPAPGPIPQNKYGGALPIADERNPPASPLAVSAGAYPADTADEDDARCIRRALKQLKRLIHLETGNSTSLLAVQALTVSHCVSGPSNNMLNSMVQSA